MYINTEGLASNANAMKIELLNSTDYQEKTVASAGIDLSVFTFVNVFFGWFLFSFLLSLFVWSRRPVPVSVLGAECQKTHKKLR